MLLLVKAILIAVMLFIGTGGGDGGDCVSGIDSCGSDSCKSSG